MSEWILMPLEANSSFSSFFFENRCVGFDVEGL